MGAWLLTRLVVSTQLILLPLTLLDWTALLPSRLDTGHQNVHPLPKLPMSRQPKG
jgi:hypothetical protein